MPGKRGPNRSLLNKICDSTPAKVAGLVASIIAICGLASMFHKLPAKPAALPVATTVQVMTQPTVQSSSGSQSPNISNVGGSVDIHYGSTPSPSAKKDREAK